MKKLFQLQASASLLGVSAALLVPSQAMAGTCTETPAGSGTVVCSGQFDATDGAIQYAPQNDGVTTVILDSTADTINNRFWIQAANTVTDDLSIVVEQGATVRSDVEPDNLFLNNRGSGSNSVSIAGTVSSTRRAIRFRTDLDAATDVNMVEVLETGFVESGNTAVWIRAAPSSLGALEFRVAGQVEAGSVGAHISQFNLTNDNSINVEIAETGDVFGGETGVYVGNSGTGRININVLGRVAGGSTPQQNFFTGPPAAINIAAESGGSQITIGATGIVTSEVGVAIRDWDDSRQHFDMSSQMVVRTAGTVEGDTILALDDDVFFLEGGSYTGDIYGDGTVAAVDDGDDMFTWSGGTLDGGFFGQNGSDVALVTASEFDGNQVLDGGDDVSTADGWSDALTLQGLTANAAGANIANWERVVVDGGEITFTDGMLETGSEQNTGLFIVNGGVVDGGDMFALTGNLGIETGSSFRATGGGAGVYMVSGNLTNAGEVTLQDGAAGDQLTVGGDYIGEQGTLALDVALGSDDSATDSIIVNGDLLGTSLVSVANAGGAGGLTTGDGIRIVQVNGASTGALMLDGGAVDVGAFRYLLFNGGISDPADQDWYLRSQIRDIVPPGISIARIADNVGLAFLGTFHERAGDQGRVSSGKGNSGTRTVWGRIIGRGGHENASSTFYGDTRSSGQIGGIQMGLDIYRGQSGSGSSTTFGAYGGYADAGSSSSLRQANGLRYAGSTRSDGYVAGIYATHHAGSGWYADAVVQGSWLDNEATGRDGTTLDGNSETILASLELGKPFGLHMGSRENVLQQGKAAFTFEPQLQIIYGSRSVDSAVDSSGIANLYNLDDSWTGRAGFRLTRQKATDYNSSDGLFTSYLKANYWNTFSGGNIDLKVGVSDFGRVAPYSEWVDIGLGGTLSMSENAELFFDADTEIGLNQTAFHATGRAGVKVNW